ncbi:MAG: ATP synthase F1 subunit delta [SAR202 cluster bacterium]|nr:ATP synthase F1 subunit delta [SAR202 cluster bacterium]
MARRPTARRYAQAAFALALEGRTVEQWQRDLERLADAVGNNDFAVFLESPQVPENVKYHGVQTVLRDASEYARNLLSVLVEHRQVRLVRDIKEQFQALVDNHQGVARAVIVTAVPLVGGEKQRVADELGKLVSKRVLSTERIDPAILGGLIARVGDRLIDGSSRTKLESMREALALPPAEKAGT